MADLATSATSQGSPTSEEMNNNGNNNGNQGSSSSSATREQDRFLPIANISRIMKKAVPGNAKIAKDAKDTVQECVSEFISFITSEASDKCQREKRKTINGDDLLWAMGTLGFEDYVEPLKLYLQKYREMEGDSKGAPGSKNGGVDSMKKDVNPYGAVPNYR
eukprot:TRINITY_DN2997_c0_g1_i2.p1 TRINITY_DN2997_c0_g1~~TRINITY_DN2997_c0_g1_i2.p1  ORF type:complete len:162 (-),score=26.56 TRINITY_DN2997_c0_g1_i2:496-981(-)